LHAGQTIHRETWHVDCDTARKAATIIAGQVLQGTAPAAKRAGVKFADAFAEYVAYLEHKAREHGKPARWAYNVQALGNKIMLPQWATWTLGEMGERPDAVADWHKATVKRHGATSANHCARIIRAMYRRRAGLDRTLNVAFLPTSGVRLAKEKGEQKRHDGYRLPDMVRGMVQNSERHAPRLSSGMSLDRRTAGGACPHSLARL
jgi:hypothetical protein